ncbi:MAG: agmatinase [Desulforhopalus sp.]
MNTVQLIGLPTDINSTFMRGPAKAPARIRNLLSLDMMNSAAECGAELGKDIPFEDIGDLELAGESEQETIEHCVATCLTEGKSPLILGGDHSVTYPVMKAISNHHGPVNILHVDAHPDLYQSYQGNPLSHASPFTRIMEDGLAKQVVQVGIRTLNKLQQKQADRFGVKIFTMRNFSIDQVPKLRSPLYISIDLDGLDPAYAPGVSHHEPGGLSARQLLDLLGQIDAHVVGGDIVEYNPDRDLNDMTAAVAVKLLKELAALTAGCRRN